VKKFALTMLLKSGFVFSFSGPGHACDFCLLSQGISPFDTMKASGVKIKERYALLDQVCQGLAQRAIPE